MQIDMDQFEAGRRRAKQHAPLTSGQIVKIRAALGTDRPARAERRAA